MRPGVRSIFTVAVLLLLIVSGCKNPFTPKLDDIQNVGEDTPDEWLPLTTHGNVLKNFLYVYNFQEKQLSAVKAIALYESLFVDITEEAHQFWYEVRDPLDLSVELQQPVGIQQELDATGNLFENVESRELFLSLIFKNELSEDYDMERAEDTGTGHEGEDWYVYNYSTTLDMEHPTPGEFPFKVLGNVIFKIRFCADGRYKIVRWIDLTTPVPKD